MIQDNQDYYLFKVQNEQATYKKLPQMNSKVMSLPGPETDKYRVTDK